MIQIHYVPPASSVELPELPLGPYVPAGDRPSERPFAAEQAEFVRGRPSRLTLDGVGGAGRQARNARDVLSLSEAWQALSREGARGPWLATLQDATTRLDAEGNPNLAALRQARAQLQAWLARQNATPAAAARIEAVMGRLIRRNAPEGALPFEAPGTGRAYAAPLWERLKGFWSGPNGDARALHRHGLKLYAQQRPDAALDALEAAAEKAPGDARIRRDLGRTLMEEGYYPQAEWALLEAQDLAPRQADLPMALGELYTQMQQPLLAAQAFKQAIALDPTRSDAHTQLGVTLYESGQVAEAVAPLQTAVSLDPRNVVGRFYLAQVALQQNDVLRANYLLGTVHRLNPRMDLSRFGERQPVALAAQGLREGQQAHHWKLPRKRLVGKSVS